MKHTNQNFNNQKLIYKKANNMMVFSITDHTNDTWDIETYNNLIIKFVQFDPKTNNANIYIPIYVDANEFRAVCASILAGTFSKINFGSKNDSKGTFISYGGSKNGGLAKKRMNGQLAPIITNKPEARWLIMSFGTDGYFYVKGQVYEGSVAYGGAITKQGKPVAELFFKLTQEDVLVMAQTVVSYLQAKETLALLTWQRLNAPQQKIG